MPDIRIREDEEGEEEGEGEEKCAWEGEKNLREGEEEERGKRRLGRRRDISRLIKTKLWRMIIYLFFNFLKKWMKIYMSIILFLILSYFVDFRHAEIVWSFLFFQHFIKYLNSYFLIIIQDLLVIWISIFAFLPEVVSLRISRSLRETDSFIQLIWFISEICSVNDLISIFKISLVMDGNFS